MLEEFCEFYDRGCFVTCVSIARFLIIPVQLCNRLHLWYIRGFFCIVVSFIPSSSSFVVRRLRSIQVGECSFLRNKLNMFIHHCDVFFYEHLRFATQHFKEKGRMFHHRNAKWTCQIPFGYLHDNFTLSRNYSDVGL